mmetsp:Transcript_58155/g.185073  ORF Transcript_58155/g.185073 Transcript_58155/m.185073 type:complete len:210 (-) Transcript_58155:4421-5050(-)
MQNGHPEAEGVLESWVRDPGEVRLEVLLRAREEAARLAVGRGVGEDVQRRQARVLPCWHENNRRLVWLLARAGVVDRLGHSLHARVEASNVEALDGDLEGHGPHSRVEVEERVARRPDPLPDVLGVGQGGREGDDARGAVELAGDVARAACDNLDHRALLPADEVHLVHDEEVEALHVLPLLPPPRERVPVLRRGQHHLPLLEQLQVHC